MSGTDVSVVEAKTTAVKIVKMRYFAYRRSSKSRPCAQSSVEVNGATAVRSGATSSNVCLT